MTVSKPRKLVLLSIAWAAALSILTAIALPPQFLTADQVIQVVMSLQKLTLFMWGQNRIANVLPLAVAWITNPGANLAAVLVLPAMFFYSLLLSLARLAVVSVRAIDVESASLKTFMIVSAVFCLVFKPGAIYEITIAHFEYSLPALLLVAALHLSVLGSNKSWRALAAAAALVFVANGVNPSTVIPAVFIAAAASVYKRRLGRGEIVLAIASVAAFVAWSLIARRHGGSDYTGFDLGLLPTSIGKIVTGMVGAMKLEYFLPIAGTLALARGITLLRAGAGASLEKPRVAGFVFCCAIIFVAGWFLLFAGNRWVEANGFYWRYFIFTIFAALFCGAIWIAQLVDAMGARAGYAAAILAAAMSTAVLLSPPVPFEDYKVFREARANSRTDIHLYAGDYWLVWPAVLRDMIEGHEAYGLALRGEVNRAAVRDYVRRSIRRDGRVRALCLRETLEECSRQIASIAGPVSIADPIPLRQDLIEFRLGQARQGLHYQGARFMALPSQVGVVGQGSSKRTNDNAGFLSYGPYAALDAGRYRLKVFGMAQAPGGAYADVAVDKGTRILAKFPLQPLGSTLVRDAIVLIPADAQDVELRVWVSEDSVLQLTGYQLSGE